MIFTISEYTVGDYIEMKEVLAMFKYRGKLGGAIGLVCGVGSSR